MISWICRTLVGNCWRHDWQDEMGANILFNTDKEGNQITTGFFFVQKCSKCNERREQRFTR